MQNATDLTETPIPTAPLPPSPQAEVIPEKEGRIEEPLATTMAKLLERLLPRRFGKSFSSCHRR
jgi:hypothetical protein